MRISAGGKFLREVALEDGVHEVVVPEARLGWGSHAIEVASGGAVASTEIYAIPGWLSLLAAD